MSSTGVTGFDPGRLRTARSKAGLTQRDLAERLTTGDTNTATGIEQLRQLARRIETVRTQVHHYETGQRTPRVDMLHRLGRALGVDPLTLLNPRTRLTLAILRARHGLHQADVAAHLTCGRAYYARIETGQANPNPTDRHRLATLLMVAVDDIDQAITDPTTVAAALAAP